ncbi:MAG: membrane dipeptidase [Lentisphaeria bacterium]|nr:membrane dipeptidase [Lentisphaeria bacterium]
MNTEVIQFISENHEKAWNSALAVLNPTKAQLEHGLELHRLLRPTDHFGFLPTACWNHNVVQAWNDWKARNIGQFELSKRIEYMQYDECCNDPECANRFRAAMRASGLKCTVQTVAEGKSREEDLRRMACNAQLLRTFRDTIAQAGTPDEIEEINKEGKTAVVWSVNGPPLSGEMESEQREFICIDDWRRMGVRLMHLSYNRRNLIADGCAEESNGGLSELGRELIARLNKAGIIVDVPHTGLRSSAEAAKVSKKPIMASHTAARSLFDFIRCKDDETLKAIADGGGLVGVYAYGGMLGGSDDLAQMLNHIEYIAKNFGEDHVGIGTDLQYGHNWPQEVYEMCPYPNAEYNSSWWGNWKSYPSKVINPGESVNGSLAWINWPLYTVGLVTRGFTDERIEKILGGNFMRVFRANCEK